MHRRSVLALALAAACVGCGSQGGVVVSGRSPSSPATPRPGDFYTGPPINWDNPGGAAARRTTLAAAKRDGALPFDVPRPAVGMEPVTVQVADPAKVPARARSLYLVYRFPTGPEFPEDGRLVVSVEQTTATVRTLRDMAEHNQPADGYEMVQVAGREALLIQDADHRIGHVVYIADGVRYSVTGPAVSPAAAVKYAGMIVFGQPGG